MHIGRWSVAGVAVLLGLTLVASAGFAAPQQGNKVSGTIQAVSAGSLTVAGRSGNTVVKTTADTTILEMQKGKFEDIRQGDSVRVIARQASDKSLTALAIQKVPADVLALQAGQRSPKPGSDGSTGSAGATRPTQISGVVGQITGSGTTRTLSVSSQGSTTTLSVPENVRVSSVVRLQAASLKPGMLVFVTGSSNQDGSITAMTIMVREPRR